MRCFELLEADRDVTIVRVRNKLAPSHPSAYSAGFRNLLVNLRFSSARAARLGVHFHVCELQLNLTAFAPLQTSAAHLRYQILRNCLGAGAPWSTALMAAAGTWLDRPAALAECLATIATPAASSRIAAEPLPLLPDPAAHTSRIAAAVTDKAPQQQASNESLASPQPPPTAAPLPPAADSATPLVAPTADVLPPLTQVTDKVPTPQLLAGAGPAVPSLESELLGQPERNEVRRSLEMGFRRIATSPLRPGGDEDASRGRALALAVSGATAGSVWDTGQPVAAAMCKPAVPLGCVGAVFSLIANLIYQLASAAADNRRACQRLRLTVLEVRDGRPPAGAELGQLGPLLRGCVPLSAAWLTAAAVEKREEAQLTITYPAAVMLNGWRFLTAVTGDPAADPIRFRLDCAATVAEDSGWAGVGSSSTEWAWSGRPRLRDGRFPTPLERGADARGDLSVPIDWSVLSVGGTASMTLLMVVVLIMCTAGQQLNVPRMAGVVFLCRAVLDLAASALHSAAGRPGPAGVALAFAGVDLLFPAGLIWKQQAFLPLMGALGVGYFAPIAVDYLVHGDAGGLLGDSLGVENSGLLQAIGILLVWAAAAAARARSRSAAAATVATDAATYARLWARIRSVDQAEAGGPGALTRLEARVEALEPPKRQIRQMQPQADGTPGPEPVREIEQVLVMAAALQPFLLARVKAWAAASGALVPLPDLPHSGRAESRVGSGVGRRGSEFLGWDEVLGDSSLRGRVRWARLKTVQRAVEKMHRSYQGDPSRLLDCCRQAIYYRNVEGILQGLEAIATDPTVRLERVQNRLRDGYDANMTAGYRDVSLNLRIASDETLRLGVAAHVAELQLILVDFARIKTEDGHRRYVTWRNLRGA